MVQIRLEAKTYVIDERGNWVLVWDQRETLKPEELDKVGGGVTIMAESPRGCCPSIYNE
jgi:hypothetical protein